MKNTNFGTLISGNFSPSQSLSAKEVICINRRDDGLHARTDHNSDVFLEPLDEGAEQIISSFSSHIDDKNESIYSINDNNQNLVVVLSVFNDIRRFESNPQHFYIERLLLNKLQGDGTIRGDEVKFLKDHFMNGRSIFVINERSSQNSKEFRIIGSDRWVAVCEHERPGVIKIAKLRQDRHPNYDHSISQWFGNIKFVKFDEAIKIHGISTHYEEVRTDDIFLVWGQYLDFKKRKAEERVRARGFLQYKRREIVHGKLILHFDTLINNHPLLSDTEYDEFDIILYEKPEDIQNTIDDILIYKKKSYKNVLFLGECKNFGEKKLEFELPNKVVDIPQTGTLILSDSDIRREARRREEVLKILHTHTNSTAVMLNRLAAGESDSQTGSDFKAITADVLDKMFGNKSFPITENYREAMNIAINTPDLALIQGPPGTGKTTLIKGIVARLNAMGNKHFKILVSSEQHEALNNVVEKLSSNKLIPPYITSKKYGDSGEVEDSQQFEKNTAQFQKAFSKLCDDLLSKKEGGLSDYSVNINKIIYAIQSIRQDNYAANSVRENMQKIREVLLKMGMLEDRVKECFDTISGKFVETDNTRNIKTVPHGIERILKEIDEQQFDIGAFDDDGPGRYHLHELQRMLKKQGIECPLPANLLERLNSDKIGNVEVSLKNYREYITELRNKLVPQAEQDETDSDVSEVKCLFDNLLSEIYNYSKNRKKDFYDIVEELKFKLIDTDNIITLIKRYTSIVGSTCAQAKHSVDKFEMPQGSRYDYVIIDEAARANPLDIMLPIMLSTRVILVGDQNQLPHFIESREAREFAARPDNTYDGKLLEKSLFSLIYERVEKSWNDGKLKFKRHIRINEQHRMHPVIGDFISIQFYNGEIANGSKTVSNVNDFGVYNGKNVVYLNIPITAGLEEGRPSYYRVAEAQKVLEELTTLTMNNQGRQVSIGIISFYKQQSENIQVMLEKQFPPDNANAIECGTVDSFQGKEFDIVFLSTVRSNEAQTAEEGLGFIHHSKSRINVSLSRAKRLLVVVGDARTFAINDIFKAYIDYVKEVGYYA